MQTCWATLGLLLGLAGCITDPPDSADKGASTDAAVDAGQHADMAIDATPDATPDASPEPPCIHINPGTLEFGAALPGRSTVRPVRVGNCGYDVEVEVLSVRLSDDTDPAFSLAPESVQAPFTLAPLDGGDNPGDFRDVLVSFLPVDEREFSGTLIITSTDPERPVVEIPLTGHGTRNQCPVAVLDAGPVMVEPLDIVELDGSASTDADGPGGMPVRYIWTLVQQPDGSTAAPVERFQDPGRAQDTGISDDPTTPRALFLADLAGTYVLELSVADNLDLTAPSDACPQPAATVTIEARPSSALHVQLTWNTPGDPNQTNIEGADVDLHLRHPDTDRWWGPFDCHFANRDPDWGPVGDDGDPALDTDDTNGAGPENITLLKPEDTSTFEGRLYRIGVEYKRAENPNTGESFGPSEATVRVYLGGQLAGEFVGVLEDTGHFWEVADIVWTPDERRVVPVNRHPP